MAEALSVDLQDAAATGHLGAVLAAAFPGAARRAVVVHLQGELGAGKTTLVRSFLRARGVTGKVRSPTFTLVEPHVAPGETYVHVDLYRLRGGADLGDLGLADYMIPQHVLLIEWPERGGRDVPAPDLTVDLEYAREGRRLDLRGQGDIWATWRRNLVSDGRLTPYLSNLT
jgi:tRNA threonylcarbamoyladenosine biosynthesis protein TsaE